MLLIGAVILRRRRTATYLLLAALLTALAAGVWYTGIHTPLALP
ncbi:MAG: hypothetical protein ACRDF0_11860 [Candidatus Limnocylindria bacterium]